MRGSYMTQIRSVRNALLTELKMLEYLDCKECWNTGKALPLTGFYAPCELTVGA